MNGHVPVQHVLYVAFIHVCCHDNAGKVTHSMTAHLDSVTSLAIDPHGLYLLSGGEFNFTYLFAPSLLSCHSDLSPAP